MEHGRVLKVKGIDVLVYKKDIRNLHLNVLPPSGAVRVSVPKYVSDDAVRLFVIKKFRWIKRQIDTIRKQARQTKREFVSGESHYFKGVRYILRVEHANRPKIEVKNKKFIYFYIPEKYSLEQKRAFFEKWLRYELKKELAVLVPKWEKITGLKTNEVRIKKMKTKWGSCNPDARRIWINLELIKKPMACLEYVILHELIHFLEPKHNEKFKKYLKKYLPQWEQYKRQLNEFIL